jgi:hypothetical protein
MLIGFCNAASVACSTLSSALQQQLQLQLQRLLSQFASLLNAEHAILAALCIISTAHSSSAHQQQHAMQIQGCNYDHHDGALDQPTTPEGIRQAQHSSTHN